MEAHRQVKSSSIVISMLPEGIPADLRDELVEYGITPLQGVSDAFTSIERAMGYGEVIYNFKDELESTPTNLLVPSVELNLEETYFLNE